MKSGLGQNVDPPAGSVAGGAAAAFLAVGHDGPIQSYMGGIDQNQPAAVASILVIPGAAAVDLVISVVTRLDRGLLMGGPSTTIKGRADNAADES
jgi:hypothetical protein